MDVVRFKEILRESQQARSDLFAWGAVIDLLEGSSSPSARHHNTAVQKCIKTAQAEMQKALKRMDAADSKLLRAQQPKEQSNA